MLQVFSHKKNASFLGKKGLKTDFWHKKTTTPTKNKKEKPLKCNASADVTKCKKLFIMRQ